MSEYEDFQQSAASAEYDEAMAGAAVPEWAPVDRARVEAAAMDAFWDAMPTGGLNLDPPMSWGVGDAVLIEVR